jgi:hypothetical protein
MFGTYKFYLVLLILALGGYKLISTNSKVSYVPEEGRYYNSTHKFSIVFPEGWPVEVEDFGTTFRATNPNYKDNQLILEAITVSVEDLPYKMKLDFFYDQLFKAARSMYRDFNEIEKSKIELSGEDTYRAVYTYTDSGDRIKSMGYTLVNDDKAYFIVCVVEDDNYSKFKEIFEKSALSFRFED